MINDGYVIEKIKNDVNFKRKIKEIILSNKNSKYFNVNSSLDYNNADLFMALNNTQITVIGTRTNNEWNLQIEITDRYDFTDFKEIDEYNGNNKLKSFVGCFANNLAMISVASGVLNEYNVTIKFEIRRNMDGE